MGRGGRIWPVGALEFVAYRRVGESWSERLRAAVDERAARLGNVSAQVHVHACGDERDGHPTQRVPDDDGVVRTVEGVDHHPCILGRARVDVLAWQLWRNHAVAARFELGGQGVPRPGAVPGAVHERVPHVRLPLIDPIFLESLWAVQRSQRGFRNKSPERESTAGTRARPQGALAASAADSPARSSCSMFLMVVRA